MKSSETVHCGLVEVGATAEAPAISVPSMIALFSRYLLPPFWSQEAMTSVGLSRLVLAPELGAQVSFWKSATACAYCLGSTPAGGVVGGPASAGAVAAGAVAAGALAAGALAAGALAVGAGAKPCGVADPDGWAEADAGAEGDAEPDVPADGVAEPAGGVAAAAAL